MKGNSNTHTLKLEDRLTHALQSCMMHFDEYYSYRAKAKESLYDGLHLVFAFALGVRDYGEEAEIDRFLSEKRGITVQSNTSLELKCIKLIYNFEKESEDRLRKWARVLIAAHQHDQDANSFKVWLEGAGGIKAAAEMANAEQKSTSHDNNDLTPDGESDDGQEDSCGDDDGSPNATWNSDSQYSPNADEDEPSEPCGSGEISDRPETVIPGTYIQIVNMKADGTFDVLQSTNDKPLVAYVLKKLSSNDNISENEARANREQSVMEA